MKDFIEKCKSYISKEAFDAIDSHMVILPGMADEEILNYSAAIEPDIIMMGTKGGSKNEASLMGSVTERIIKKAKVAVMAIPEAYEFVGTDNIDSLLYLTEFDESDFLSIKKLMALILPFDIKIYCSHTVKGKAKEWDTIRLQGLVEYFKKVYGKQEVDCLTFGNENLFEDVDNFIRENNIRILSLTTRKRKLIQKILRKDLTKKFLYQSTIPVLIFHS